MMKSVLAYARQPTTIQGIAALVGAAVLGLCGCSVAAWATPLSIGIVLVISPDNTSARAPVLQAVLKVAAGAAKGGALGAAEALAEEALPAAEALAK